jgi:hypothetical protein
VYSKLCLTYVFPSHIIALRVQQTRPFITRCAIAVFKLLLFKLFNARLVFVVHAVNASMHRQYITMYAINGILLCMYRYIHRMHCAMQGFASHHAPKPIERCLVYSSNAFAHRKCDSACRSNSYISKNRTH